MRAFKSFRMKLSDGGTQLQPGEFVGHASMFGNVDLGGDRVKRGAFARTIKAQAGRCVLLWSHNTEEPIGMAVSLEEDADGLKVHGQLNLEVQRGRECYALLKQGAIKGLSFGYDVIRSSPGRNGSYRELEELKLYEISPVTFAMNPEAAVERVKALAESGNKYVDFAATDGRAELYQARYRMADSLASAIYSIMGEDSRTPDERLGLAQESLEQYRDAVLGWCSRYMEAMSAEAASKDAEGPDETKAGRVLSAANRAKVQAALTALQEVLDAADPGKSHSTATGTPALATPEAPRPEVDEGHALKQLVDEMTRDAASRSLALKAR